MTDTPSAHSHFVTHYNLLPFPLPSIDQPRFERAHEFLTDLLLILENRADQTHPFLLSLEEVIAYIHLNLESVQPLTPKG